jgi:hypothetical protein
MKGRPFAGAASAMGGVLALMIGLVAIDGDVREEVFHLFRGGTPAELTTAGYYMRHLTSIVILAVKDQSLEHAPLVIFAVAATVLTVFMLRT